MNCVNIDSMTDGGYLV